MNEQSRLPLLTTNYLHSLPLDVHMSVPFALLVLTSTWLWARVYQLMCCLLREHASEFIACSFWRLFYLVMTISILRGVIVLSSTWTCNWVYRLLYLYSLPPGYASDYTAWSISTPYHLVMSMSVPLGVIVLSSTWTCKWVYRFNYSNSLLLDVRVSVPLFLLILTSTRLWAWVYHLV